MSKQILIVGCGAIGGLFAAALSSADRMDRKFGWYEWDRGESTIAELVDLVERHK